MAGTEALTQRPAWKALQAHHAKVKDLHLRKLFAEDPRRGERLAVEAAGIYLDYSKNRITDETVGLLVRLAEASGLRGRIDAMFRGEKINVSERRAALHVALRAPREAAIVVDGENVVSNHIENPSPGIRSTVSTTAGGLTSSQARLRSTQLAPPSSDLNSAGPPPAHAVT